MNHLTQSKINSSVPCSICGKGPKVEINNVGPNDDPHACGDCSDKGNINAKVVSATSAAKKLFGFNPF